MWPGTAKGPEVGQPIFCKIPRGGSCTDPIPLSLPAQSPQDDDGVIQPFPVLGGAAGVVYVVGPRYNRDDTLIWTSTNGGESFTVKEIPTGSFPDKTGVGDVLFNPNFDSAFPAATDETFAIAGENPGLGYGYTSNIATETTPTSFTFANPGAFTSGATLGFTTKTKVRLGHAAFPAVEAYWTDTTPDEVRFYRYPAHPAPETEAGGWEGPFTVTDGYEPRLAGGPDGLFLLSTDLAPGAPAEEQPSVIDVRKYNETTETFGAPTTIANIPTGSGTLFTSGDIFENSVTGALYVVQPVDNGSGEYVMRLWESTDGGQTFHGEREIATIGYGFTGVPRLAVAEDGQGWLTFKDEGGLEVADLNPLSSPPRRSRSPRRQLLTRSRSAPSGDHNHHDPIGRRQQRRLDHGPPGHRRDRPGAHRRRGGGERDGHRHVQPLQGQQVHGRATAGSTGERHRRRRRTVGRGQARPRDLLLEGQLRRQRDERRLDERVRQRGAASSRSTRRTSDCRRATSA